MKNRSGKIWILTAAAVFLISGTSYGFEVKGKDETGNVTTATDPKDMGNIGTEKNPIISVDGTGAKFEEWAEGKYFSPDCTYRNITSDNNKTYRLTPIYEAPKYTVTLNAGGGHFGEDDPESLEVSYNDNTLDSEKEVLSGDTVELGAELQKLTPAYEGYYPYFYYMQGSTKNKRIFINKAEMTAATDVKVEDAVYDLKENSMVTLVWKDCEKAEGWNDTQKAAAYFLAKEEGYDDIESYCTAFGGDSNLSYGTVSITKDLPGATNKTHQWILNNYIVNNQTSKTFTLSGLGKYYDNKELQAVIKYGTEKQEYSLETDELKLTAYQRPFISGGTIE